MITNNADMTISMQGFFFVGVFFFCKFMFLVLLGAYTEVELLGSMVTLFLTF